MCDEYIGSSTRLGMNPICVCRRGSGAACDPLRSLYDLYARSENQFLADSLRFVVARSFPTLGRGRMELSCESFAGLCWTADLSATLGLEQREVPRAEYPVWV
jgi:hypothetical protein